MYSSISITPTSVSRQQVS